MKKNKIIALITARGGSKGLPRKNILPLLGKPLISWTIESALKCSDCIDKVLLSTEDSEIADVGKKFGAEIINRPPELASDNSSSLDVIQHAIEWCETKKYEADVMILLQPTSPLRNNMHIDEAISLYLSKNAQFVVSVFEPNPSPIKAYIQKDDGSIEGIYSADAPYQRRQDLPMAYQPNGAIYIFDIMKFKLNNKFPKENVYPYIMTNNDSVDIDSKQDLFVAENLLREKI